MCQESRTFICLSSAPRSINVLLTRTPTETASVFWRVFLLSFISLLHPSQCVRFSWVPTNPNACDFIVYGTILRSFHLFSFIFIMHSRSEAIWLCIIHTTTHRPVNVCGRFVLAIIFGFCWAARHLLKSHIVAIAKWSTRRTLAKQKDIGRMVKRWKAKIMPYRKFYQWSW